MNRFVTYFALLATLLPLIACGDSSDYGANSNTNAANQTTSSQTVTESNESSSSARFYQRCYEFELYQSGKTDSFTDSRDGQIYKKVKIGTQTWMAENLNYETDGSFCYGNDSICCNVYGRLYTWAAAMDSAGLWSENGKECGYGVKNCSSTFLVRGICPEGWHLPSMTEWKTLIFFVTGDSLFMLTDPKKLKSTRDWEAVLEYSNFFDPLRLASGCGSDDFGFSALPAGFRGNPITTSSLDLGSYGDEIGSGKGFFARFWSSTDWGDSNAAYAGGMEISSLVDIGGLLKRNGFSVRCIQDDSTLEEKSSSSESLKSSSSQIIVSSSSNRSSSSNARLSSETAQSSSSGNTGFVGGTLVDSRDGRTYATVTIGSQTWMAENLNFKTDSSFCYNSSADNCEKYGRLYTWENAKSACPRGWHLPSNEEWGALFTAVGGQSIAGSRLKFSSGWNEYKGKSGNGSDSFGFSSLPAGYRNNNGNYYAEGNRANFWSSSEIFGDEAYNMCLHYDDDNADLVNYDKGYGVSVRCLKD